ncbi:MAG: NADH-quinone oxidoreductase subunit M [Nitrospinae bacterium]|nr:NADH-quinone oxidoreductase subunit M [Nitrospinota bacterium]
MLLSAVTFIPLAGVLAILFVGAKNENLIRIITLVTGLADLAASLLLWTGFNDATAEMQFVERIPWISGWGAEYYMGIDGISLLMVILTTVTCVICYLATWTAIERNVKEFNIAMLVLQTAMIGVFCALDFLLFYVFWEMMLIPMYLLIGVWGGKRRIYATVKFFIYTMAGSVLMLLAILVLYFEYHSRTGVYTFDILKYYGLGLDPVLAYGLFLCFFIAFAIKVPVFPFHTWLPDAHVEAPTAGSVILAGVLLKMGTYGFLRFSLPLFPEAAQAAAWWISWLALIGIVYGALVAMVQEDIKKLVAYSSVSHLGFVVLGTFAFNLRGIEGGVMQMINHGISTGALFLIVGILYERRHTREIGEYGGITRIMPKFAVVFMIVTLSSIGLPLTNGFVGEFMILLGVFEANKIYAAVAATGVIFGAVYMLWMFQRVMFGEVTNEKNKNLPDLTTREFVYMTPLIVLIFVLGVYPNPVIKKMEASVKHLVTVVEKKGACCPPSAHAAENAPAPGVPATDGHEHHAMESVPHTDGHADHTATEEKRD